MDDTFQCNVEHLKQTHSFQDGMFGDSKMNLSRNIEAPQLRKSLDFENKFDVLADNCPRFGSKSPTYDDFSPDLVSQSVNCFGLDASPSNVKRKNQQDMLANFFLERETVLEPQKPLGMTQLSFDSDVFAQKFQDTERHGRTPEVRYQPRVASMNAEATDDSSVEDPPTSRHQECYEPEKVVRRLKEQLRKERNRASAMRSNMNKLKMRESLAQELKHCREKAGLLRMVEVLLRQENMRLRQSFR